MRMELIKKYKRSTNAYYVILIVTKFKLLNIIMFVIINNNFITEIELNVSTALYFTIITNVLASPSTSFLCTKTLISISACQYNYTLYISLYNYCNNLCKCNPSSGGIFPLYCLHIHIDFVLEKAPLFSHSIVNLGI